MTASQMPQERSSWAAAWWNVVRFGLSVLLISLALSLLACPWVALPWWQVVRRCVSIAAVLSLWLSVKKFDRRPLRSYGFTSVRAGKRDLLAGVILGGIGLSLMLALGLATGTCRIDISPDHSKLWRTVLGFIPAALLVGLLEELVFRGVILQHLLRWSRSMAVIASSGLYAIVHLKSMTFTTGTFLELGGLFLLGLVLALSYLMTQQLYLPIGLHASLAYGARVNKLLIEFPDPAHVWFVGTSRLVNGVAAWIGLLAIGALVTWWVRRGRRGGVEHGNTS